MSDTAPRYMNPDLSFEERVDDLVDQMTLEEKVSQMIHHAAAIERLGVPAYNWWNECLHGVARAGIATVFPQAIGMGATFDTDLISRMSVAVSDEARAKHHEFVRQDDRGIYKGLTFWSPNVNIFRDPRWGRGQETYGEDPCLTAKLGVEFVKGLQGDDPHYFKLVATAKHFAVHSGPEADRHRFNAIADERDMRETYLPAFEALVCDAGAYSVMGAYNRTNGEACCASHRLIGEILRDEWAFDGYFVSDCWAIKDIYQDHGLATTPEEAAALAVNEGCDLNCGEAFESLVNAVNQGLISEETVTLSVKRLFLARFKLGMFDPAERVAYANIPYSENDSEEHRQLALEVALKSMVLLKNKDGMLPLNKGLEHVAVIGPNADDDEVLLGNYNGTPSRSTTPLAGIRNMLPEAKVTYAKGCDIWDDSRDGFAEAVDLAAKADVAIVCLGLNPRVEGEEDIDDEGRKADRDDIILFGVQEELLKEIVVTGTPVVLVLLNGSALAINWADEHVPAIVEAWYPGEEGGAALASVLFGDYNPAGRLPITFARSVDQLPDFTDYAMYSGHTYRFLKYDPLYPFGYGLSYTQFAYSDLKIDEGEGRTDSTVRISALVKNMGQRAGEEVVQLYVTDDEASYPVPVRHLEGFARIALEPGESKIVCFTLKPTQLAVFDDEGVRHVEPGTFTVSVGGGQPLANSPLPFVQGKFSLQV